MARRHGEGYGGQRQAPWRGRGRLAALVCGVAAGGLAAGSCARAVEIGRLRWFAVPEQPPYAEIELNDPAAIDPGALRGRLAARDSYDVAGLLYDPRLANLRITPQREADGRVSLRLDRLPADAPTLDLLLLVSDRQGLSMAEFHLDLRQGPFNVPPSPPGTRLAGGGSAGRPLLPALPPTAAGNVAASIAAAAARALPDETLGSARVALQDWAQAWSRQRRGRLPGRLRPPTTQAAATFLPAKPGSHNAASASWRGRRSRSSSRR